MSAGRRCRACDLTLEWDFGNNGVSTGVLEHLHNLMLDQGVGGVRFLHVPYSYFDWLPRGAASPSKQRAASLIVGSLALRRASHVALFMALRGS